MNVLLILGGCFERNQPAQQLAGQIILRRAIVNSRQQVDEQGHASAASGPVALSHDDEGAAAIASLAELRKANEALHNVIDGLGRTDDLGVFLEKVLIEGLRAAGTENGAVILIENGAEFEVAYHVVIQTRGEIMSPAIKLANDMERVPYTDAVRKWAKQLAICDGAVVSKPGDDIYPSGYRDYLIELGVDSIHTVPLRVGGRMIGWFGVGYNGEAPIRQDRLALLRLLADQMTIAVELARLGESTKQAAVVREKAIAAQERSEQLARANKALRGAIDVLASELGIDAMLAETLGSICSHLLGTNGIGFLWMTDAVQSSAFVHSVFSEGHVMRPPPCDGAFHSRCQPIAYETFCRTYVDHHPRVVKSSEGADGGPKAAQQMIAFPMFLAGMPVGAFELALASAGLSPTEDDIHLGQALAQQATLALQLTRLAEEGSKAAIEREKKEAAHLRVEELAKANRALKDALDLASEATAMDDTLSRMLPVVSDQIDCTSATLCIREAGSSKFFVKLAYVDGGTSVPGSISEKSKWPAPDERLALAMLAEEKAVILTTLNSQNLRAGTQLGVPLLRRGEIIGCFSFHFDEQRTFSVEQLELLQTLAHQATLVLQLERLAKAAQRKSQRAATLAERARIARDLHDTLAQGLTGILMHLQASERTSDTAQARIHSREALNVARGALVDARRAVYALRSIASDRLDFSSALKGVLRTTFAGSGIATEVQGEGALRHVSDSVEKELLRIAQEAATNALKHARATRFDARVTQNDLSIEVILQDDGVGFNSHSEPDGFGLTGINERAIRIGAELTLITKVGAGTKIIVILPFEARFA